VGSRKREKKKTISTPAAAKEKAGTSPAGVSVGLKRLKKSDRERPAECFKAQGKGKPWGNVGLERSFRARTGV